MHSKKNLRTLCVFLSEGQINRDYKKKSSKYMRIMRASTRYKTNKAQNIFETVQRGGSGAARQKAKSI